MELYTMDSGLAESVDAGVAHGHGPGSGAVHNEVGRNGPDPVATDIAARSITTSRRIPLVCSICPKNSKFSDVSHLLTHIASKGHLSHKFHLEIARDTDEFAHEALTEYETWFETYGIRELLQNRSDHRQKRGEKGRPVAGGMAGSLNASMRGGMMVSRDDISTNNRGKRRHRGNTQAITHLDYVKCEPEDDEDSMPDYNPSSHWPPFHMWQIAHGLQDPNDLAFQYFAGLQGPAMHHQDASFLNHQQQTRGNDEDNEDAETSSKYAPSNVDDDNDDHDGHGISPFPSENTIDTTLMEGEMNTAEWEALEAAHNAKYLKGPQYDGMYVFDAANKEDRKKRNQKKDPSVAVGLKVASENVTSREYVMDFEMKIHRYRDVRDPPSVNGSEDEKDEHSSEKKRKGRSPNKTRGRGRANKPRGGAKSSRASAPSSRASTSAAPGRGTRRRGAPRGPRGPRGSRGSLTRSSLSRATNEATPNASAPVTLTMRTHHGNITSAPRLEFPGHSHGGSGGSVDFRANVDASPDRIDSPAPRRPQDNVSRLALRPGNPNHSILSPTIAIKHHPRRFTGKENHNLPFPTQPTTSNPYLTSYNSLGDNSLNPLCAQPRESVGFRLFSSFDEDMKPPTSGFQPTGSHNGHNILHFPSRNDDGYQPGNRYNEGVYEI